MCKIMDLFIKIYNNKFNLLNYILKNDDRIRIIEVFKELYYR